MHGNEDKLSTKTHLSNFLGQRQLEHDAGRTGTARGLERRRRFLQTSAAAARAWDVTLVDGDHIVEKEKI